MEKKVNKGILTANEIKKIINKINKTVYGTQQTLLRKGQKPANEKKN